MDNKNKIKSILLKNGFDLVNFPLDVSYTEVSHSRIKKVEGVESYLSRIEMIDYPYIGYTIDIPQKSISKILNPNKIIKK